MARNVEARDTRMVELNRAGLSNEDIQAALAREFPGQPVTARTVAERLWGLGEQAHSQPSAGVETDSLAGEREMLRLRDENAVLRKQKISSLREQNLREAFLAEVRNGIALIPPTPPLYLPDRDDKPHQPQTLVLQLCCLHLGEFVSPVEMGGFGGYDVDLATARFQYLIESTLDLALNHHSGETFDEILVVNEGDTISGFIHDELAETNLIPIGRQPVLAGHLLSLGLRDLAPHFPKVKFVGVPGNHPRLYRKPRFKNKVNDNLDTLVYEQVGLECANLKNVEVVIPGSFFHIENIKGFNAFFAHGDGVKGWAGIPYYGFDRAEARLGEFLSRKDVLIDYWCWGNFHTAASMQKPRGARIMTGSFKGPDEFALGAINTGSDPVQALWGVHPRRGRSFLYDVNLSPATPELQNRYSFPLVSSAIKLAREAGLL